jgi:hypothetical protein
LLASSGLPWLRCGLNDWIAAWPLRRGRDDRPLILPTKADAQSCRRGGSALIDLVPVDGQLGRVGGAVPGRQGRNLEASACASNPATIAPSSLTWRATALQPAW